MTVIACFLALFLWTGFASSDPAAAASGRLHRIVIDPGHGGKDPGAMGRRGTEEKEVNLQVGLALRDLLRARGYDVYLTRSRDEFVSLADRTALANKVQADFFLSLHCNASRSRRLTGFEIYFLSEEATDPQAAEVARLENAAAVMEESRKSKAVVKSLLRSLERNEYLNESSELASLIAHAMEEALSLRDLGVKQADFHVLRGARMPAVLLEMAFLSNSREEKLLRRASFRRRLARAVVSALATYNQRNVEHTSLHILAVG